MSRPDVRFAGAQAAHPWRVGLGEKAWHALSPVARRGALVWLDERVHGDDGAADRSPEVQKAMPELERAGWFSKLGKTRAPTTGGSAFLHWLVSTTEMGLLQDEQRSLGRVVHGLFP